MTSALEEMVGMSGALSTSIAPGAINFRVSAVYQHNGLRPTLEVTCSLNETT